MKAIVTVCATAVALAGGSAWGEPTRLTLDELASVTAGTDEVGPAPNGGAIVGNGSSASLASTGEVAIGDGAQTDVRALNFVNSSESAVANGVNVFDGRADDGAAVEGAKYDIAQQNVVAQDQRRLSSLPSYERGANTETMTTDAGSSASEHASSTVDDVIDLERTTFIDEATTNGGFDRSSAPTLRIDAAGDLQLGDVDLDGEYSAEFNMPSAGSSVGVVFNGELDYGIDGGDVTLDTGDVGVTVGIELPELDLDFDAMGCVAVNGSCTIEGTRTESTEEVRDQSTYYSHDESSSSSETWDRTTHEIVNAPFELRDARAEYIVVDESDLDVVASYLVSLSGEAQSELRALNAVNSAGSAVANGVNVATQRSGDLTLSGGPVYKLSQVNTISHSR